MESLFWLVWNNKYLRKEIFKHLHLFNIFYSTRPFNSFKSIQKFKYLDYLNDILIHFELNKDDNLELLVPQHIQSINFYSNSKLFKIPYWIKRFQFEYDLEENTEIFNAISQLVQLESLLITFQSGIDSSILINSISMLDSLTELDLTNYPNRICNQLLPKNLKILSAIAYEPIQDDVLPDSLQELSLIDGMGYEIFKVLSFSGHSLPSGLVVLDIYDTDIPCSIPIEFQFPSTLQVLKLSTRELNFKLPSNLESLTIDIKELYNPITKDKLPTALKELVISQCVLKYSDTLVSSFPDTLTRLSIKRELNITGAHILIANDRIFPPSLTYLDLSSSFNREIGPNVLPSGLRVLKMQYHHIVTDEIIPYNLQLLEITNQPYQHSVKLSNPSTAIDIYHHLDQFRHNPESLISFKAPPNFNESLEWFKNLQYLDLSGHNNQIYCRNILNKLPTYNTINTLVLGSCINKLIQFNINIDNFQHLETIIINYSDPTISTSTDITGAHTNSEIINYNFYKLKQIQVPYNNTSFLQSIDPVFFQFITLTKSSTK